MRSAVAWMAVLAMMLAACGTPTTGDTTAEAPSTSAPSEVLQNGAEEEARAPEPDGLEAAGDDGTPTGTDERQRSPSDDDPPEQSVDPVEESGSTDTGEESLDERPAKQPERVGDGPTIEPVTGEVPDAMLAQVMADLSSRTGAPVSDLTVVRAEAVVWNDGSLGCPQPDLSYTMALVDGYWIEISHGSEIHDYRAGAQGYFTYCEGGGIGPFEPND